MLAQGAALAVAFKATYVNLHTGLSEREIGRAQAGFDLRAKQSLHKAVQHALQVAQGNALIHNQTFHLVEHRGVGCVRVRAEHAAGHQNFDGGLFLIHHTDLAAAGLGAQNNVIRHIEGILHIAGRVVFGYVQAGKVVVIVLNFGAFVNFKAHAGKHINDLILDLGDRMQCAGGVVGAGQGDIHGFGLVAGGKLGLFDLGGSSLILALHPDLELVDGFTGGGAFLFGNIAQGLGQSGHAAVFAQILLPKGGKFIFVVHCCKVGFQLGAQCGDFFFHNAPL